MDKDFLVDFKWIVIGALIVYLGIIAAVGTFLILRWRVFRPISSARHEHKKELTPEEQRQADQRRRKVRFWFWGGR